MRGLAAWVAVAVATVATGCFTVYQPLVGFQRPIAIDPQLGNFDGLHLHIHCLDGEYLPKAGATDLCRHLETLFTNQGAVVHTSTERAPIDDNAEEGQEAGRADLVMELRSRLLHEERNNLLRVMSILTATLVPAIDEFSYSQDISVRDADGFMLTTDTYQARFVTYSGAAIWSINKVVDMVARDDAEDLIGDASKRDFSRDFYGQASQVLFNATTRWRVLRASAPTAGPPRNAGPPTGADAVPQEPPAALGK